MFEMVSGFTTTGASVVLNVEELSHCTNMWGKVKTVLQMLSIIFYFFGTALSYRGTVDSVSIVVVVSIALCWLVAAVTAISGIKYLWDNRSFINTAK